MSQMLDFHGLLVPIQHTPHVCPRERVLPFGTPVVLKRPHRRRTQARIASWLGCCGRVDRYALFFEGFTNSDGSACIVDFNRDEFVLARSGT
jgi:hypothetical protein